MYPLSPAGVTGTTGFRCRSLRARLSLMTLLCPAGYVTRNAINFGIHSQLQIQPESNVTGTVSRSGPILEMAIYAATLKIYMEEGQVMFSMTSHGVKVTLIRDTLFLSSDARIVLHLLIQNVLQVIQISLATYVNIEEVALVHTCLVEAPLATKIYTAD